MVLVAKVLPGIGSPLKLSLRQFAGVIAALADDTNSQAGPEVDHRAAVEAHMRKINGRRQT